MADPADILAQAKAKGVMIATAESCTGGLVFAALTDIPGSSAVMERGFITYTNDAKKEMLGVKSGTLDAYGAVSEEVAIEMAQGACANSKAQIAVSITGIAGPGGSEHKPEGRVCFGITNGNQILSETMEFGAIGRENVRNRAQNHALNLISQVISSL